MMKLEVLAVTAATALISLSAIAEAITSTVDPQDVAGWAFGILGTGGLFWKVWSDRSASARADDAMSARVDDLKEALERMTDERDYWRNQIHPPDPERVET